MKKRNIFISLVAVLLIATLVYSASIVTKGLIGKQDVALWYSGDSAQTYTRSTSEGYTMTLNKLDWVGVDVSQVYGGGVNRTGTVIASAALDIGKTEKRELFLSPGTWTITSDLDLSDYPNLIFKIPNGALLSPSITKTLTLYSPANIIAQPGQIFSGAGAVTFSVGNGEIPSGWYPNLNTAVANLGSLSCGIVVSRAETLTANLTIPATCALHILPTGSIIKASTYTLAINGSFEAGTYQVFSGFTAGNVTFGTSIGRIFLQWWGTDTSAAQSAFASNPPAGSQFFYAPTGRQVLYQYNGSTWSPIQSFGTMTIYVDGANGTDSVDRGWGTTTNAYATIQYAINQIPPIGDSVHVNIAAGTYTENLWISGKRHTYPGDVSVTITGAMDTLLSTTATGGNAGLNATHAQVTGTFSLNQYDGKLIKFTSGANSGYEKIIGYTTITTLWLLGEALPAAPQNGDTYLIYDWLTIVNGVSTVSDMGSLKFKYMFFIGTSGACALTAWGNALFYFNECKLQQDGSNYGLWVGGLGLVASANSYFYQATSPWGALIKTEMAGAFEGIGVKLLGNASHTAILADIGSSVTLWGGCEISNANIGILVQGSSSGTLTKGGVGTIYNYIRGCASYGICSTTSSSIWVSGGVTYGVLLNGSAHGNGTNALADAASYGSIVS